MSGRLTLQPPFSRDDNRKGEEYPAAAGHSVRGHHRAIAGRPPGHRFDAEAGSRWRGHRDDRGRRGRGLDRAAELDVDSRTRGDLDVGAMVRAGRVKLGANVRNLTKPKFGAGNSEHCSIKRALASR